MKVTRLSFVILLLASGCSTPLHYVADPASTRRAVVRGELKEALASYEAQAQEAEKSAASSWFSQQYRGTASSAYTEASKAARELAQLQKSIAYGEKALTLAEQTKDPPLQLSAIQALIASYRTIRDLGRIKPLIEKGLVIAKDPSHNPSSRRYWEGALYVHLGGEFMRERDYEGAIDAFSQALSLHESHLAYNELRNRHLVEGNRETVVIGLSRLGQAFHRAGKLQQAMEQYQRALNAVERWGLKSRVEVLLYLAVGELYVERKDFLQALESFQKALSIAEGQRRPEVVRSASVGVGNVLLQTGRAGEAIPYYQKSIFQIESTRSLLEAEGYRQSYFEGRLDAYVNVIDALATAGNQEEAFNYSERARSRVFLDVLGSRVQLSRVKSGLLEEERALQERIAAIKARLAGEEGEGRERAELRKELGEAEKDYSAFLAKVRKENKEQASLMTVDPLTLKDVQKLLDPGTTLIEYFVTESQIFIWVVEKEKLQFQRMPLPKEDLAKLVKTLRDSIFALGEKDKFREASAALYKQLVQPVLSHITGKEVIIVPHDVLHYLPFHALISPKGRYLIEDFPIHYLSSASLLQFTKEKRKAMGEKVLALGNPDLGDPKMSLQFAGIEAKEIKNLYPQSTIYLEKEATEERAKTLSPQNDIIHFASHAELNENDPLSSAVLLAKSDKEDGRLEVREIFGMDLKASLVVLSACETGLGKLSSGDELVGLTRAFIYAGTPSVVASLWKVEDSSTAALMASFYKNLKTMTKVEALRQAQLELIRGQSSSDLLARRGVGGIGKLGEVPEVKSQSPSAVTVSTSHPYFWAPFILVGDGK